MRAVGGLEAPLSAFKLHWQPDGKIQWKAGWFLGERARRRQFESSQINMRPWRDGWLLLQSKA